MRRFRPGFAWVLTAVLPLLFASSVLAEDLVARVLLYHRVADARYPSTSVSREAFRAQLEWLGDKGFSVVSTADLEGALLKGKRLPEKSVVIHFDDGYRSVFEEAFPVLRELGVPFTVFLPVEAIDKEYPDFVTWEMVAEMARHGGTFGVHGVRHLRLEPGEVGQGTSRSEEEFRGGAARLRTRGFEPRWLAYPYGEYTERTMQEAQREGFTLAFSQDPGSVGVRSPRFRLPRFAVVGSVGDMATFRERMAYRPLTLEAQEPPFGFLDTTSPAVFRARVADPGRYEAGSASVFVSELGKLPARFDASTGLVSAPGGQVLRRRLNRVLVSLREKAGGGYAVGSWVLLDASAPPP